MFLEILELRSRKLNLNFRGNCCENVVTSKSQTLSVVKYCVLLPAWAVSVPVSSQAVLDLASAELLWAARRLTVSAG